MTFYRTIEIRTRKELLELLFNYERHWMFRGHAEASWGLVPSLERLMGVAKWDPDLARRCEDYSLHEFKRRAHHYITHDSIPSTTLAWLALMQHHGVPTRLLDFTESPFVALFFAFDGVAPRRKGQCAIWAIDYRNVWEYSVGFLREHLQDFAMDDDAVQQSSDQVFEKYIEPNSLEIPWIADPLTSNSRLEKQKGTFLVSGCVGLQLSHVLQVCATQDSLHKITISASLSGEVFRLLNAVAIDHRRLFGDLGGLATDVKREMEHQSETRAARN